MIYVYRLPDKLSNGYCFGGGNPIDFVNVDWFDGEGFPGGGVPTRDDLTKFIVTKRYYRVHNTSRFLVLGAIPEHVFIIEPSLPDNLVSLAEARKP